MQHEEVEKYLFRKGIAAVVVMTENGSQHGEELEQTGECLSIMS